MASCGVSSLLQTSLKVMAGILEAGLSSRCSCLKWQKQRRSPCFGKHGRCSSPVDLEGASDASQVRWSSESQPSMGLGSSDWAHGRAQLKA